MSVSPYNDMFSSDELIEAITEDVLNDPVETDRVKLENQEFLEECENTFTSWNYGMTLINDAYFTEYAKEYAADCVNYFDEYQWPFDHIDWDTAADALKYDFSSVKWQGETFWGTP